MDRESVSQSRESQMMSDERSYRDAGGSSAPDVQSPEGILPVYSPASLRQQREAV
jgi:hypothetical protein